MEVAGSVLRTPPKLPPKLKTEAVIEGVGTIWKTMIVGGRSSTTDLSEVLDSGMTFLAT
jgi:hypothetical protein